MRERPVRRRSIVASTVRWSVRASPRYLHGAVIRLADAFASPCRRPAEGRAQSAPV